jgi:putative ABC transport system permease protein
MTVLELRDVSKSYGEGPAQVTALAHVSLSVAPGTMVAVMGPSGAGKSTLLTIAGGLEDPAAGEVLVGGAPLSGMSRNDRARLRRRAIGFVFQDYNLLAGLTAAENVSLPLELDGVPARRARAAGMASLGRLGLASRAGHYPDQLSGGERQRVSIARAVVGDRQLLLADEPSGALDTVNGEAVMGLIRTACERGIAAVVVTHDAHLASWADQTVSIRDGHLISPGRPRLLPIRRHDPGGGSMTAIAPESAARRRPPNGGAPARRAVARWAWRLFRREWRQQLLVLALITVAVAATILGAGIATNTPPPEDAEFGGAHYAITLPGSDPHLAADIASITSYFSTAAGSRRKTHRRSLSTGPVQVVEEQNLTTGSVNPIELRAEDPDGPFGRSSLSLVAGRYPAGPGQVALTQQVAALYNIGVGGHWPAAGRAWRVTGLVADPDNLRDEFALVAPGELPAPDSVTILLDAAPSRVTAFSLPRQATLQTPPPAPSGFSPAVVVGVLAVFGLLFAGLIAVAGFTVLAQRRLRALGMISALGATDRHVRLVMAANGAVVGTIATLAGAATGLLLWLGYAPHLQSSAGHRIDELDLPWRVIAAVMAFAVLTAIRAARRPARVIARMPVVAALAGRPPRPGRARRTAIPGLVFLAAGAYLLAYAGGWGASGANDTLHLLGGLVAITLGSVLVGPLCIGALAVAGRRAPVAVRLAVRDLARYRARSGAALSAVSVAVLIAVLTCLFAAARYSDAVDYFGPNLPSNQVVIYTPAGAAAAGLTGDLCASSGGQHPAAAALRRDQAGVRAIAASLQTGNVLTLETATGLLLQTTSGGTDVGQPYVATPGLLAHYGIQASQIEPGAVLLTSRAGLAGEPDLRLPLRCTFSSQCPPRSCIASPVIQTLAGLPADLADPDIGLTTYAVRKYGLHPDPAAWLVQARQPLTAAQINGIRQRAEALGLTIETKNDNPSLSQLDTWATAAGILLALGVLAMTVGLVRSETAADLRILTATGATSTTRRGITATTAAALGLLGAVVGTAVAYLAALAYFRSQLSGRLDHVPALDLILILAGLPALAATGGWVLAGREPPAIARQPAE